MSNKSATLAKPVATELATTPKIKAASRPASSAQEPNVPPDGKLLTDEAIRLDAYLRWEAAGKPQGDGVDFWLQAETELRQVLTKPQRSDR